MRVAVIIPRLAHLGPIKVMQVLVNNLREYENLQIKMFYIDDKTDPELKLSVPVERLIPSKFCFEDFDIIHTNGIRPDLFAWFYRKRIKYHISTIHNLVFEDLSFSYNKVISLVFGNIWLMLWRRADKLVCVSKSAKNYYEQWFPSSRLEVVYNGIAEQDNSIPPDEDLAEAIDKFKSEGFKVIGSAGILTDRKGIDRIFYFLAENSNYAFIIIGDGNELSVLRKLSARLKIADRIIFSGFRKNADIYFRHFDFFVMPSKSEGFGLALVEAVREQVPVICSDIPVFRELFTADEVTFFNAEVKASLREAFEEATALGKTKAVLACNRYQNTYTANRMAKGYFDLYKTA
jgi:L-malate glycosyltransferase